MNVTIRQLTEADDEQANDLLNLAFHSSTNRLNDLRLYRRLQPDGWFAACLEDRLIGTVGAISYGTFAHVGFMTVHPDLQGQGIGCLLMAHVLSWLESQNVPLVTLDASKKGFPLYEKLGFITLDETSIFERHIKPSDTQIPSNVQPMTGDDLDDLVQADTLVFGANRRKVFQTLLDLYPSRAFLTRGADGKICGFIFGQANRIGPWVMLSPGCEEQLLQFALTLAYENPVTVCVPSANQKAAELLERYGFEKVRAGMHMAKGRIAMPGERQKVFAQTSLGAG